MDKVHRGCIGGGWRRRDGFLSTGNCGAVGGCRMGCGVWFLWCVSSDWKNIFDKVKLFLKYCVKGYEQHKMVKKNK